VAQDETIGWPFERAQRELSGAAARLPEPEAGLAGLEAARPEQASGPRLHSIQFRARPQAGARREAGGPRHAGNQSSWSDKNGVEKMWTNKSTNTTIR
jgi:hypothetical protein